MVPLGGDAPWVVTPEWCPLSGDAAGDAVGFGGVSVGGDAAGDAVGFGGVSVGGAP